MVTADVTSDRILKIGQYLTTLQMNESKRLACNRYTVGELPCVKFWLLSSPFFDGTQFLDFILESLCTQ